MSLTIDDGGLVPIDPNDSRVLDFNYDSKTNLATGVTVASSTFRLRRIVPVPIAVTSITRASTTATVTQTAHGYLTNDWVTIAGADQSDYNITAQITVLTADTFSYTVANAPTTPATGTITSAFGVGKDNPSILAAAPANRVTQIRVIGGGDRSVGQLWELANQIVTSETPTQTKEKSVQILVEQQ